MKKMCYVLCVMCQVFFLYTVHVTHYTEVFAQPISSEELIAHAARYDGQIVTFQGEAIGDIMIRGQSAWINVRDGKNALGIFSDKRLLAQVRFTGDYTTKGDLLQITGEFHRVCPVHGGDLDIHAQHIVLVAAGRKLTQRVRPHKITVLWWLAGILAVVWILTRLKIR